MRTPTTAPATMPAAKAIGKEKLKPPTYCWKLPLEVGDPMVKMAYP